MTKANGATLDGRDFIYSEPLKALQMRVAEPGRVLQAVSEQTINADVSPNDLLDYWGAAMVAALGWLLV